MNPTEQQILELCKRLEELGLNLRLDSAGGLWANEGGQFPSLYVPSRSLVSLALPEGWQYLEALLGFVECEIDRLGKWERYWLRTYGSWVSSQEFEGWQVDENIRRPTPLEKLQAAVEAMEG